MEEILFYTCQFVYELAKVWCTFGVLAKILKPKRSSTVEKIVEGVAAVLMAGFLVVNLVGAPDTEVFSASSMLVCAIITSSVLVALCEVNWLDGFFLVYVPWVILQIVDFFIMTLVYYLLRMCGLNSELLLHVGWGRDIYLLLFAAVLVWLKKWIRVEKGLFSRDRRRHLWEMVLIPALTGVMLYFQHIYTMSLDSIALSDQYTVNWGFFAMTVVVIACFAFIYVQRQKVQENDRLLQLKLTMLEQNYNQVLEMYQEKASLLHDEKNHMRVLSEYLEAGKAEDAARYIGEITEKLQQSGHRVWSGNSMLDMILNMKQGEAGQQNIRMELEFDNMRDLKLKDTEICALFANLLDNAIEANLKITDEEKRWITLYGKKQGDMLIINLSNAIGEKVIREGKQLPTSKEDKRVHGFGMQSIQKVVDAYSGEVDITDGKDTFSLVLYLMGFERE